MGADSLDIMKGTLGLLLLKALSGEPRHGHEIMRWIRQVTGGAFQVEEGAIYPALRRLEQQGLVRGSVDRSNELRPKQIYRLTRKGVTALENWLRTPLTGSEIDRGLDFVLLKFSYMGLLNDPELSLRFLASFQELTREAARRVKSYSESMKPVMPLHGRLALENGIAQYRGHAQWAGKAMKALEASSRKNGKS